MDFLKNLGWFKRTGVSIILIIGFFFLLKIIGLTFLELLELFGLVAIFATILSIAFGLVKPQSNPDSGFDIKELFLAWTKAKIDEAIAKANTETK